VLFKRNVYLFKDCLSYVEFGPVEAISSQLSLAFAGITFTIFYFFVGNRSNYAGLRNAKSRFPSVLSLRLTC
jgi:hypothetical protein